VSIKFNPLNGQLEYQIIPSNLVYSIGNQSINGKISFTNNSASVGDSPSDGAVVIAGALGVSGNINAGNGLYLHNTNVTNYSAGNFIFFGTSSSTSTTTGCVVFAKGIGVGGDSYFGGSIIANEFRLSALNNTPSSSSDTGTLGEIRYDANYIYVCVATNTWKRSPISTW